MQITNHMKRLIQFKTTTPLLLMPLLLVCFACLPSTQAVTPAPDGAYPGYNTAEGLNALLPAIPGVWNTAIGAYALSSSAPGGLGNTAVGLNSLRHNTTGTFNTAVGVNSLLFNTTGSQNVAIGYQALDFNGTDSANTAVGFQASFANNNNGDTTAVGWKALWHNTGSRNCAFGSQALFSNTTPGNASNAFGYRALFSNTTGVFNNAFGWQALFSNIDGFNNTAMGDGAGDNITSGDNNTCLGANAGNAISTANGVVAIGLSGANVDNTTYIRNVYPTIQPVVGVDPDLVTVNSSGRLGRANISSRRYKHDIKSMDKASEAIFKLKPVSFRYNKEYDATQTLAFGLIAEEVAEVYPDLVGRNPEGQPESVRYEQINAMVLNEFLKEHQTVQALKSTVEKQEAIIAQQQKGTEVLTAQLKEQATQIQKVSAQLELNKRAPRTVANK